MLKKTNKLFYALAIVLAMVSCSSSNTNEDKVRSLDKDGSLETIMSVDHLNDSLDILKIHTHVWVKGELHKTNLKIDTIPALGMTRDTVRTNDDQDSIVDLKKKYQVFFTMQ